MASKCWCMSEKALHSTNDVGPDIVELSVTIQLSLGTKRDFKPLPNGNLSNDAKV